MKINSISTLISPQINFRKKLNKQENTEIKTKTTSPNIKAQSNAVFADMLINKKKQHKIEGEKLFIEGINFQKEAQETYDKYKKITATTLTNLTKELNNTPKDIKNADNFTVYKEYDNGILVKETNFFVDENEIILKYIKDYETPNICNFIEYNDDNTIKSITLGVGSKEKDNNDETEFLYKNGEIAVISKGITLDFDNLALNTEKRFLYSDKQLLKVQKGIHSEDTSDLLPLIDYQFSYQDGELIKAEENLIPKTNQDKQNYLNHEYISELPFRYV